MLKRTGRQIRICSVEKLLRALLQARGEDALGAQCTKQNARAGRMEGDVRGEGKCPDVPSQKAQTGDGCENVSVGR